MADLELKVSFICHQGQTVRCLKSSELSLCVLLYHVLYTDTERFHYYRKFCGMTLLEMATQLGVSIPCNATLECS